MCYEWPAECTNLFIPLWKPHWTRLLFPSLHTIINPLLNTWDSNDFCIFFPFDFESNHNNDLVWKFSSNFRWILMLWTCSSPLLIGFLFGKIFWFISFSSRSASLDFIQLMKDLQWYFSLVNGKRPRIRSHNSLLLLSSNHCYKRMRNIHIRLTLLVHPI